MKIIGSTSIGAGIRFIVPLFSGFNNYGLAVVIVLFPGEPYFITLISSIVKVGIKRSSGTYRAACFYR